MDKKNPPFGVAGVSEQDFPCPLVDYIIKRSADVRLSPTAKTQTHDTLASLGHEQ
jgi:hypothetical protein